MLAFLTRIALASSLALATAQGMSAWAATVKGSSPAPVAHAPVHP